MFSTLQRATDTYLYVADLLAAYSRIRGDLIERLAAGTKRLADEVGVLRLPPSAVTDSLEKEFQRRLEEGSETKAAQYPAWLINQGLVSLCTIFDVFLEGLVDAIFCARVEALYGVAGAKNLELKRLVELGSLDAILSDFRAKEVKAFGFQEIRERFTYLSRRLGLDTESTFRFERFTDEARKALQNWNLNRLVSVYEQRHDIVHRDDRPLKKVEEFEEIYEVFCKLVLDLSAQAQSVHNVLNDGSASLAALAEQLQSGGSVPGEKTPT